jgi:putative transposase
MRKITEKLRRLVYLMVNDECCRKNLAAIAGTSISGAKVARELDALVKIDGEPAYIARNNDTECTGRAIFEWAKHKGVDWHYIDPGKPQRKSAKE